MVDQDFDNVGGQLGLLLWCVLASAHICPALSRLETGMNDQWTRCCVRLGGYEGLLGAMLLIFGRAGDLLRHESGGKAKPWVHRAIFWLKLMESCFQWARKLVTHLEGDWGNKLRGG